LVELLGRSEAGEATTSEDLLLRLLTSVTKLTTGKQVVALSSEALECFGGAGYVNDTGIPKLLADAQVLSIWEGTTNVLSLDALKVLRQEGVWEAYLDEVSARLSAAKDKRLSPAVKVCRAAIEHASQWLGRTVEERPVLEAGARRFAITLGRGLELALLIDHAQWALESGRGERALAVARRFAKSRIDYIDDEDMNEASRMVI
ncbi:MAG: acyl-CoA dehydrogenase family protein, partial [Myxococcota bacterium]